jgi:hypothetical protein
MTITALQKRCDQDDLAVNTEMVLTPFSGDAIRRRPPDHFVGAVAKLKDAECPLYECRLNAVTSILFPAALVSLGRGHFPGSTVPSVATVSLTWPVWM